MTINQLIEKLENRIKFKAYSTSVKFTAENGEIFIFEYTGYHSVESFILRLRNQYKWTIDSFLFGVQNNYFSNELLGFKSYLKYKTNIEKLKKTVTVELFKAIANIQ